MPRKRPLTAVPDRPSRVVLYVRVSALMGRGGEDFLSPDIQTGAMRRVTTGMREVDVIEDIDRTGRTFSREGIDRIRRLAETRQIDAVAVYDVSRLGRNVRESLTFLAELADQGVTILSACEQIDTSTPAGRLMLTNMLAIAEYRSDEIGRGWSATIARRAERGQHHGRPLGYVRDGGRLVPDPVVGPAITETYRRYAAGDPISGATAYLAAVRGRAMTTSNVKKILANPVYRGVVVAGGEQLPGQHDALVDDETWSRVQDRLARDAGTPPRHLAPTWALVGLAYCPHGHHLQRQPHRGRDGTYVDRLVCGMGRGGVAGGCAGVGRPRLAPVEAEVLDQAARYARRLRADPGARTVQLAQVATAQASRAALDAEVRRLRTGMTRVTTQWATGALPDEVYQASLAELRDAESGVLAELARLGPAAAAPPDPQQTAALVDQMIEMWPEMTHAERGQALRAAGVERVVVRAADRWREPEAARVTVRFRW